MKRVLVASYQQISEVSDLIDQLGVGPYRDAKVAAGVPFYTPFSRMYRLDAATTINIMKTELPKNERTK